MHSSLTCGRQIAALPGVNVSVVLQSTTLMHRMNGAVIGAVITDVVIRASFGSTSSATQLHSLRIPIIDAVGTDEVCAGGGGPSPRHGLTACEALPDAQPSPTAHRR